MRFPISRTRWLIVAALCVATAIVAVVHHKPAPCDAKLVLVIDPIDGWSSWPVLPDFGGYTLVASNTPCPDKTPYPCTRDVRISAGGVCPLSDVDLNWWFTTKNNHEVGGGGIHPEYYRLSLRRSPTDSNLFVVSGLDTQGERPTGKEILVAAFRREPNAS